MVCSDGRRMMRRLAIIAVAGGIVCVQAEFTSPNSTFPASTSRAAVQLTLLPVSASSDDVSSSLTTAENERSDPNIVTIGSTSFNNHSSTIPVPVPSPPLPPPDDASSLIDYKGIYDSATTNAGRRIFLIAMILWLFFLFTSVGIVAADFFAPNLSTIVSFTGMSESVAGCTLLAFANGSPDCFASLSALKAGSGALALGELIGAASFITMVVAGTMCLIHPFKVASHTFLRDVGFFTVAVAGTLVILWDSHIHAWEAAAMVVLYIVYVVFVAAGSWWVSRREHKRERIRQARSEYAIDTTEEYRDDPIPSPGAAWQDARPHPISPTISNNFQFPSHHPHHHENLNEETILQQADCDTPVTLTRTRSGSASAAPRSPLFRRPHAKSTVRPSLLGAIEFRDVVNSLRADSTARTLAVFGGAGEATHVHANLFGNDISPPIVDQRSRRGPHMHGRSASSGSQLNRLASMSPSMLPASDRPAWNGRRSYPFPPANGDDGDGGTEGATIWDGPSAEPTGAEGGDETTAPLVDLSDEVGDPWRDARRDASTSPSVIGRRDNRPFTTSLPRLEIPATPTSTNVIPPIPIATADKSIRRRPSIILTTAAGDEEEVLAAPTSPISLYTSLRPSRFFHICQAVFLALFPSLHEWRNKSIIGKATALLCVPAILLLNLTLPVVESEDETCDDVEEKERIEDGGERRYRDEEEGGIGDDDEDEEEDDERIISLDAIDDNLPSTSTILKTENSDRKARRQRDMVAHQFAAATAPWIEQSRPHSHRRPTPPSNPPTSSSATSLQDRAIYDGDESEEDGMSVEEEDVDAEVLTRWLTAVQCTLAPVFCVAALLEDDLKWWYLPISFLFGLFLAVAAFKTFKTRDHKGRIVLCFVGFFVAMVWIITIVNEVVGVLLALGKVFGLSDAIIGLTVFAMGNSLGDLVANSSIARMGFPAMGLASCYAGPMLNILLGLGLSGSWVIYQTGGEPLHIEISRTLMVSGCSLLCVLVATLILVPMNHYYMNRKLGASLICAYGLVLMTNVAVEAWK